MDKPIGIIDFCFGTTSTGAGCLPPGLSFIIRPGAIQIRHFGEMLRVIIHSRSAGRAGILPFQALTIRR